MREEETRAISLSAVRTIAELDAVLMDGKPHQFLVMPREGGTMRRTIWREGGTYFWVKGEVESVPRERLEQGLSHLGWAMRTHSLWHQREGEDVS